MHSIHLTWRLQSIFMLFAIDIDAVSHLNILYIRTTYNHHCIEKLNMDIFSMWIQGKIWSWTMVKRLWRLKRTPTYWKLFLVKKLNLRAIWNFVNLLWYRITFHKSNEYGCDTSACEGLDSCFQIIPSLFTDSFQGFW